jgi:hypothetical protein
MLKTTTETGDISIFSIQPSGTPMAFHHVPRSRLDMLDETTPARYTPKKGDSPYFADDHRHFRSYRDTTSEIISLYGYDHQAFYMMPGSPVLDDTSHRSCSITTNSSRQLPSQKSSGTLQSQSSGSGMQRPRSPFPYPTRLKRPGAQPASPALAEDGCIDYSRMVELDRVSQVRDDVFLCKATLDDGGRLINLAEDCSWFLQVNIQKLAKKASTAVNADRLQPIYGVAAF